MTKLSSLTQRRRMENIIRVVFFFSLVKDYESLIILQGNFGGKTKKRQGFRGRKKGNDCLRKERTNRLMPLKTVFP
jgi:hypothetical protein